MRLAGESIRYHSTEFISCLASIEVQISAPQEEQDEVAADECGKDTQIPPPVIEAVSQWLIELIPNLVGAVLAEVGCVVDKIAGTAAREEGVHILAARLAGGWVEGV